MMRPRRRWQREPVALAQAGRISYPDRPATAPNTVQPRDHPARPATARRLSDVDDDDVSWKACCYDRETGSLRLEAPVGCVVGDAKSGARYVRCYYHGASGATRWSSLGALLEADDSRAVAEHPLLVSRARRAWRRDDESYFGALRRAPRLLDEDGDKKALCAAIRAMLAPALEVNSRLDDDRATTVLAVIRALLPLAVFDQDDDARRALAPAVALAGRAPSGPLAVRACANDATARALVAVFDGLAAKALSVLLRAWRKQRLAPMPLEDLLDAAVRAANSEPPDSRDTAAYLALAAATIGSAAPDHRITEDRVDALMATLERVLHLAATDPDRTDRRATAQARLLLDLLL